MFTRWKTMFCRITAWKTDLKADQLDYEFWFFNYVGGMDLGTDQQEGEGRRRLRLPPDLYNL